LKREKPSEHKSVAEKAKDLNSQFKVVKTSR